jgi:hypothetical protein
VVVIVRDGHETLVKHWRSGNNTGVVLQSGDQVVVPKQNWLVLNSLSVISTGILVASFVISQLRH